MKFSPTSSSFLSWWPRTFTMDTQTCTIYYDMQWFIIWLLNTYFGLIVFPLRDKVVWSGTGILSFINWNIEVTNPSVCLRGRWNMSRRERIVSMALSEKRCFLPLVLVVRGFQDLMTEGDIHRVNEPLLQRDCSYFFQLVTLYFFLYFGFRLRLCISFITSSISIENIIHQIYLCTKADVL
jgi:hypothetical protein